MSHEPLPDWADALLSDELTLIAAVGETQAVEFKQALPKQLSDLAKEIAGFATSNAGRILIGISDDGEITGLADGAERSGRAELVRRIEGLCANVVRPPITPTVRFAASEGRAVAAIDIPKGSAPVYYSGNIPYLRQITAARPMTPDEVVDHVLAWNRARGGEDRPTPESRYLSRLAGFLIEADVDAREIRVRRLKPWSDMLRSAASSNAADARELAATAPDSLMATVEPLERIAESFEQIVYERPALNTSRAPIEAAIQDIEQNVRAMRARWLAPETFSDIAVAGQREAVRVTARQLAGLAKRAADAGREIKITDLQEEASARGSELLRIASLGLGIEDEDRRQSLWRIGEALRALETRSIAMDGGRSLQRLRDDVVAASEQLKAWVNAVE